MDENRKKLIEQIIKTLDSFGENLDVGLNFLTPKQEQSQVQAVIADAEPMDYTPVNFLNNFAHLKPEKHKKYNTQSKKRYG